LQCAIALTNSALAARPGVHLAVELRGRAALDRIILPGSAMVTEAASQREYPIRDGLAGVRRYWLGLSIRLLVLALLGLALLIERRRAARSRRRQPAAASAAA
jgi:hypothetical protein